MRIKILIDINCLVSLLYGLSEKELEVVLEDIPELKEFDIVPQYRRTQERFGHRLQR